MAGPRIFTAGRALVCTGGHGHEGTDTLECDGADGFRRGVRSQVSAGADLIKIMISGGIAGEHEQIDTPQLTLDEIDAAIETAHTWGRKVTAHAGPAPVHSVPLIRCRSSRADHPGPAGRVAVKVVPSPRREATATRPP